MQSVKTKRRQTSLTLKNKRQFEEAIAELRARINLIDSNFLMKLSQTIDLKIPIFSQEISSIVIVMILGIIATKKPQVIEKQDLSGHTILRIEELSDLIGEYKSQLCLKLTQPEMIGWMSKIWDRLVHSSCFRNHLDILVLLFFIGDALLQYEKQLKRVVRLLLRSFNKIKNIYPDTIQFATNLVQHFIKICQRKQFSYDLKVRLKILKLMYLSKIQNPNEQQYTIILGDLEQFYKEYLQYMIECINKNEEQNSIREEDGIWDSLFVTILRTFHRKLPLQTISRKMIEQMVNTRIDMQTVKLIIRELEVHNESDPLNKWKNVFALLQLALKVYDKPKIVATFLNDNSFIKIPLNAGKNFLLQIQLKNSWRTYEEQKYMLMIQDKNRKQQLWITTINEKEGELRLILLRVENRTIIEPTQQLMTWDQNKSAKLNIYFTSKEIKVQVNELPQNIISIQRFIESPAFVVIGDCDGTLGTSVKSFNSLSYSPNSTNEEDLICYRVDLTHKNTQTKGVRRRSLPSFVQIFLALGDMDAFLLIVSHAIKKMKNDPLLTNMIRVSLSILEGFVQVKKVAKIPLTLQQKQQRLNAVLCLCWQCSHQAKNALPVLQLLRVLSIRGVPHYDDELQVLCNFVFWKNFEWEYQRLIILKIKQIFLQGRYDDSYIKHLHHYGKRILMEVVLYYREEDALNQEDDKQHLLKIHYEFMALIQDQLLHQLSTNKDLPHIYEFLEFIIKIISLTVSRKQYKSIQAFDLSMSMELSFLAKNIVLQFKKLAVSREKLAKIVKYIIEVCFLYTSESVFFQDKTISIFNAEKGFTSYHHSVIKQNLSQLAYRLIKLYPNMLYTLVDIQEDGIDSIVCIAWQEQFFSKINQQYIENSSIFEDKFENVEQFRQVYKRLPKRHMSTEQLKKLLKIYLSKEHLFPKIDTQLTQQIWKRVGVSEVLTIIKKQLFKNSKEQSEITESSKFELGPCKNLALFKAKLLNLLASQEKLSGRQGMSILNTMKILFPPCIGDEFRLLVCHFNLKELVEKTKMMKKSQESQICFKSYIDVETKPSTSYIDGEDQDSTREQYTQCLEYYLSRLTLRNVMDIKWSLSNEEGRSSLNSIKDQLTIMMNILCSYNYNCINQLKKYDSFLQTQIIPISKNFLKELTEEMKKEESPKTAKRKSSKDLQWPMFDMKDQVKNIFSQFMDNRNQNLLKVEKTWSKIEERNKYFWNSFLPKDTVYTLYEGTGIMNERYILKKKNKKQKLELPRMHRTSLSRSASILSEKFDFSQAESVSSIFEDAHLYRKDPRSCLDDKKQIPIKQRRVNKFSVLLITTQKIYQGMMVVTPKKIIFTQNDFIDYELYKKIYASECEQRNEEECVRQNYKIQEQITPECVAVSKRYLFHDIGLELHTTNRSYFISFMKKDARKACCFLLKDLIKVIHRENVQEEVKKTSQLWEEGSISNYQYLMKINDLSGRSFNDLSQYYIFPWTVTNFTDQINKEFFQNKDNFRDMSVPVGKLSKNKWETIKKNYERSKKQQVLGMKPFLYGSFYSNPAIVTNFLIRINPFAAQHFELQSHSFDLADRLFYSVKDSYQSLMICSSDFKELIPEFYFFPEFLKNRNEYNLGSRQNKDIVNNVALPDWAQDEYEFVFRMRKLLQGQHITQSLHGWIDLIFGVYTKKQYAIRADNLFLDQLYIDSFKAHAQEKNKECVMYFKQFGQVPVSVFSSNHRPSLIKHNFMDLLTHQSMIKEELIFQNGTSCGRFQNFFFSTKFTFVLFQRQIRMYTDDRFGDKEYISINGDFEGGTIMMWKLNDEKNKSHHCLLFHRRKTCELLSFEIRRNMFNNFVIEGGEVLQLKHKVELFSIYNNILICSEGRNIYMYRNIQQEIEEQYSNKNNSLLLTINKVKYLLGIFCQFTQHKCRVVFMKVSPRGMIVTLDVEGKIYITEIHSGKISIFNYFEIRSTCFEEKVVDIIVHNYGMIIMRTDYGRLLTFTLLGDKIVDQILHFKKVNEKDLTEKIQSMYEWNPQFPELVVGTNRGNLWKLDIFALRKQQQVRETDIWIEKMNLSKEGFRKEGIMRLIVNRLGRHSLLLAYGQNGKLYSVRSGRWDDVRKGYLSGKKTIQR